MEVLFGENWSVNEFEIDCATQRGFVVQKRDERRP